ncbi:bifunctional phosphoribosylaminoimidazolecarboxamide formyltransferase/IMP cyclohydrolase [Candidatus Micrarchaeota archaeon]|nr:bifunctional phosphoribosylaminoimidazolecarboxamide formyltransferase/IMP cyclohydrolase [Candidatus Micrarchaeota archaeon]
MSRVASGLEGLRRWLAGLAAVAFLSFTPHFLLIVEGIAQNLIARRALLSVTDKSGVVEFAKSLSSLGVELVSTGGTARLLAENGVAVLEVSQFTGFPEVFGGRVKTLHPKIFSGILYRRGDEPDGKAMLEMDFPPIDLVCVNLYDFESARNSGLSQGEIIEKIDIGGPSLLRAAAKNFESVAVVCDPSDYAMVARELSNDGITPATRKGLARKAFALTAKYDSMIENYFSKGGNQTSANPGNGSQKTFPANFHLDLMKERDLRYGENPHQQAAFYGSAIPVLSGKELSYNNILDACAAQLLVDEFGGNSAIKSVSSPYAAVIVKHTNPCGVALGQTQDGALVKALSTDLQSPFGGIVAFNSKLSNEAALRLSKMFLEIVIAPGFEHDALETLTAKKNLRIIDSGALGPREAFELRSAMGGVLVQTPDTSLYKKESFKVVTARSPSGKEMGDLLFAWVVAKHAKSNAVVLARDLCTVGIGAGQMARIDSCQIAVEKAKASGLTVEGSALASDAFFPFRDTLDFAAKNKITAVIQPGGSMRDRESIDAADENGIAMVFTAMRHFRH